MPPLKPHDDREFASLNRDIDDLSERLEQLLSDFHENSVDFGQFRTELSFLTDHVREISHILRDGEHGGQSLLVRVALLEQKIATLAENVEQHDAVEVADKSGHWQMKIAMGTGILAIIGHIVQMILHLIGK